MLKDYFIQKKPVAWQVQDTQIGGQMPAIMGIVNVTPDSFFDGGVHNSTEKALEHAIQLHQEGAQILDIGGESTRPGAQSVPAQEQIQRTIPVIEGLLSYQKSLPKDPTKEPFFISIDTTLPAVAEQALVAGAHIINDVMALRTPGMLELVAAAQCSVVLNHMQGSPQDMQRAPNYTNLLQEVAQELSDVAARLQKLGVAQSKICLDPGIGFGKQWLHNVQLISGSDFFTSLQMPLLLGMSRKSYIGSTPGLESSDRLIPSLVSAVYAHLCGVTVLRVHDVKATKEAITMSHYLQDCWHD
jgi:dihydropteroate synthase